MGSYSDTIDSIKTSVDGIQSAIVVPPIPPIPLPNVPPVPVPTIKVPEPAWLTKIAKCGAELKTMASGMAEQAKTYAATIIPQTTPNTTAMPNAGSLATAIDSATKTAALAQDISKMATTLPQFTTMAATITTMINGAKSQATAALTAKANSLPNARRQSQLYANEARAQITTTQAKVAEHYDLKKELVKF